MSLDGDTRQILFAHILKKFAGHQSEAAETSQQVPLSIQEQAALLRARADALERGLAKSTILVKDAK